MYKKNIVFKISIILFVSLSCMPLFAQNWDIPAEKSEKNSYIQFNPVTAKQGEELFTKSCMSCHGNPGKENSLKTLKPMPPDLAGAITQKRTDGDIFYIISTGKMVMPSFVNIYSEEQRWLIISYLRSFNKNYVQVLSKFDPTKAKLVKINLNFDAQTHKIKVNVAAHEKKGLVILHDDEIVLFVNRYFGRLQVDKTLKTNAAGEAEFNFPTDLPGDKVGNLDVIVKVSDDNYGEIESLTKLKAGIPTDKPSLTEKRAIWNVMVKAPIWLLITYTSCVLLVLSCFLYIFYNLYRIKKSGTN